MLNRGESYNDLDLYFLPIRNEGPVNRDAVIATLDEQLGLRCPLGLATTEEQYNQGEEDYLFTTCCSYLSGHNRRIDVFVA